MMDYKEVINQQIEILKKKQETYTKSSVNRADIICLYANTISKLAETGSNLKVQPTEMAKGVKKYVKAEKATTEK